MKRMDIVRIVFGILMFVTGLCSTTAADILIRLTDVGFLFVAAVFIGGITQVILAIVSLFTVFQNNKDKIDEYTREE